MTKNKQTSRAALIPLLIALLALGILANAYYLLPEIVPDNVLDPAYGPSLLGRDFSWFDLMYDMLIAGALIMTSYYSLRLYKEKTMLKPYKKTSSKTTNIVVGHGTSARQERRYGMYQAGSFLLIALVVGVLGIATSEPSSALSTTTSPKMTSISYTKIREARTPTGYARYTNAVSDAKGGVLDTMQGGTTDGTYLYFAYGGSKSGEVLAKFDQQGTLVKASKVFSLDEMGHANGITYDSRNNRLVVTTYRYQGSTILNPNRLVYVDPETLEIIGEVLAATDQKVSTACYNPVTDQYAGNGMLFDANFNLLNPTLYDFSKTVMKPYSDSKSVGQGIACTPNNIYVLRYYAHKTKPHTHVYMYDWSGKLVAVYNVSGLKDEGENLFVLNGQMYLGVNNGSTYRGKSSDNKKDYYIRLKNIPVNTTAPVPPTVPTN